ncbi:MAG: glycoside hydrolase family 2 TIM barrel-domain containing protein [Phycisphaerae bacterium]|nr:glycoside hydrolase family 2 TIM barrel-domain containing protein [Phycisphaerae bacterium]
MNRTITCACVLLAAATVASGRWKPVGGKLMTRWARDVSPKTVHSEYPRPQMARKDWRGLNGLWDYAIRPGDMARPAKFDGKILVPFAVESALSGVGKRVGAGRRLWYRRTFTVPPGWAKRRVLLHFGAVDWHAQVRVNGKEVGEHKGGYDPFSFDITDQLKPTGEQELVVAVSDPTDAGTQPRGKQVAQPRGIWYTPVTGIWQTVWLEPVNTVHIRSLQITPDVDKNGVRIRAAVAGADKGYRVSVAFKHAGKRYNSVIEQNKEHFLRIKDKMRLWSPGDPYLYDLSVSLLNGEGSPVDAVESYFGMRKIALGTDPNGITRIMFNNKPLFQYGPLDQGWWPDGLYTAPTDAALRYDLEITKKLGFNMVRKHVKVEPARWYHHCDRLGLLVWQDMPSGDKHAPWPRDGQEISRTAASSEQFARELRSMIETHRNYPSIVVWVPFNEAWGQFQTIRRAREVKRLDPERLVIAASGGNDFAAGDIRDIHVYPGPEAPPAVLRRAAVLGEFGGLGLPIRGHLWQEKKNWGYRSFKTTGELARAYEGLMTRLRPLIDSRLSAAVYTQTTDVEIEINGLMTYDRSVVKFEADRMVAAHRKLYAPLRRQTPAEMTGLHTVAYWRFEDGRNGAFVPHDRKVKGGLAARDVSGHKNHLYAFKRGTAGRIASYGARRTVPLTGQANARYLDDTAAPVDAGSRDLYTNPGRSRTHMNALNGFQFAQWTVEASFQLVSLGRTHGLLGKDGKPTPGPHAPLQLKVRRDDGRIQIEALDVAGKRRDVRSTFKAVVDKWYHVAAVSDGKMLRLHVDSGDGKGYVLQGRTEFAGALVNSYGTWTVGRGFFGGKMTDDARAKIDEIRISAAALRPERFLQAPATPAGKAKAN